MKIIGRPTVGVPRGTKPYYGSSGGGANPFAGKLNVALAAFHNTGSTKAFSTTRLRFKQRRWWTIGATTPWIQPFYMPWGLGASTGHEEVQESTVNLTIPLMTFTFNGVTRTATKAGLQAQTFLSTGYGEFGDKLFASDFGLAKFPKGAIVCVKHYLDMPDENAAQGVRVRGFPFVQRINYDPVNEPANGLTTEMQGTGAFTFPTGAVSQAMFGPNFILGADDGSFHSWLNIGDSFTADGVGDLPISQNEQVGGWLTRAAYQNGEPFIIHGLGGRGVYHLIQNGKLSRQSFHAANMAMLANSGNDISNGHTDDQTIADTKTVIGWLKGAGHHAVLGAECAPRTSTGVAGNALTNFRCSDLVNQAPYFTQNTTPFLGAGYGVGEYRDTYNAKINANKGQPGYPDDVIPLSVVLQDPTTTSKYGLPAVPTAGTVSVASGVNASQVSLSVSFPIGDSLVFDVGNSTVEPSAIFPNDPSTPYTVQAVSGAGPFLHTFATADTFEGGGLPFGHPLRIALTVGLTVKNTRSSDETHCTTSGHKDVAAVALPVIRSFAIIQPMDVDADIAIQSFPTPPDATRRKLYNSTIISLKEWGLWTPRKAFYLPATFDQAAGRRNLRNPGVADIIETVAPTWTLDRGYTFNGTTHVCTLIDFGLAQDNVSLDVFIPNLSVGNAGWDIGSVNFLCGIRGRSGANASAFVSCGTGFAAAPGAALPAHLMIIRSAAGLQRLYVAGNPDATSAVASTGAPNTILLGKSGAQFGNRTVAQAGVGDGSFSDTQIQANATIIKNWMTSVGAA